MFDPFRVKSNGISGGRLLRLTSEFEAYFARAGFEPVARQRSIDGHLVMYVCKPCAPKIDALPAEETVREFLIETTSSIRTVVVGACERMAGKVPLKVLGIIPARGGSKGLPGKNIRKLRGKPLIQIAHECATASGVLDRVILSTDAQEIADVGRQCGIEVPFMRPQEHAHDETPMIDVVRHAIAALAEDGYEADAVMLLQPTSPLRTPDYVARAVELLGDNDSVCTVVPVPSGYSPHYLMKIDSGYLDFLMPDGAKYTRRQDLPLAYKRDGTIFLTRTSVLMGVGTFYGEKCLPMFVDPEDSLNIDTLQEWKQAERRVSGLRDED